MNGFNGFLARDEIERGICDIEQSLGLEGIEGDDFEAAGAADAEFGAEEVDGGAFCWDVEFLFQG